MNAFILAGGRSTRMGRDKALLPFRGRPLIEHAVAKLRALGFSPRVAGTRPDLGAYAAVIPDHYPGSGPLAGIEAALCASDSDLNLFLPIDLPLLPAGFLRWLSARAHETSALATIPCLQGRPQPLCAVYHRNLLPYAQAALAAGDRKVTRVLEKAAVTTRSKLDRFDLETVAACVDFSAELPIHRWLQNLNTPVDLQIAALEESRYIQ
ncbi:MAG: molybdenum cofactor guanylyltransferase [Acidobacteriaceae bacterium]|nr:molybdenum cofactor guanylyltransferase [Acidobacteriaceae bacterium]